MTISAGPLLKNRRLVGGYALSWYALLIFGVFVFTMESQPLTWWLQLSFFLIAFPLTLLPIFASIEIEKSDSLRTRR